MEINELETQIEEIENEINDLLLEIESEDDDDHIDFLTGEIETLKREKTFLVEELRFSELHSDD